PVVASGLDEAGIRQAVLGARPEVVVHEMTDLRGEADLRHFDRAFATSNKLRTQGTDYLLSAARAAGTRRFIAQSFCGWPYAPGGNPVKDEMDELEPDPPKEMRRTLNALRYLESVVGASDRFEGIVLRYGALYGSGTGMLDERFAEQIRQR